jgi:hypothetical protein
MTTTQTACLRLARLAAVFLSVLLSLYVALCAQASSPDYQRLFMSILPFALINAALIAFIFVSRDRRKMWIVGIPALLGFASYAEMACRVLLGFRLL